MAAELVPIGAITATQYLGVQVPLNGTGASSSQTFTATSSNPDIKATIAKGQFLTFNISHVAADANDVSFAGAVTFQLFEDLTPKTAAEIESIVKSGFYTTTGNTFHRIASGFPGTTDFIEQGGSVNGQGGGNSNLPGTPFPDEFNQQLAFTGFGQLAMANSGPDTNDTQFFITTGQPTFLNFKHTIFGQVVSDPSGIIQAMTKVETTTDTTGAKTTTPLSPINITGSSLSSTSVDGVVHIDSTTATPGETSTVTVTATDASGETTSQSFPVTVQADTQVERPFLQQPPYPTATISSTNPPSPLPFFTLPTVVFTQNVGLNQPDIFQVQAVSPTPGDQLTYTVQGGVTTNTSGADTFVPVTNATATIDQTTGVVTVTPNTGYTGPIYFLVGVRDQVNRAGGTTALDSPDNYDYHRFQLNVGSAATNVNLAPIALPAKVSALANVPTSIQLMGNTANPNTSQTLTYALVSQPTHGTITNFNAQTGTLTYTPAGNFVGTDNFQFQVSAVGQGASTPALTSAASTETINVSLGNTGAVRLVGRTLVVTPVPRTTKGTNTIFLRQVADPAGSGNPVIQVFVNGEMDATQPFSTSLDRIIVYGSKSSDDITVDPSVDPGIAVTLDGGHGGKNVVRAGAGTTREHGWFGDTVLFGGTGTNQLIGRAGNVHFKPTKTTTEIFAGAPSVKRTHIGSAPGGTFYKFRNGRVIPVPGVKLTHVSQATTE